MPLMFPRELSAARSTDDGERRVYEALKRDLDDRWWVFYDRIVVAHGEEGRIDFILMHHERGLALLAVVGEDVDIAEEPAREAVREMLRGAGFGDLFGSLPAIAVVRADPARLDGLGRRVDAAFGSGPPAPPRDRDWVEWVADRLSRPGDFDTSAATPVALTGGAGHLAAPARAPARLEEGEEDGGLGFTGPARRQSVVVGGAAALILLAAIVITWPAAERGAAPPPGPAAAAAATTRQAAAGPVPSAPVAAAPTGQDATAGERGLSGSSEPPVNDGAGEAAHPLPAPPPPRAAPRHAAQTARAVPAEPPHSTVAQRNQQRREQRRWWQRIEPGTPQLNQNNRAN
jgi:hypothetical protein